MLIKWRCTHQVYPPLRWCDVTGCLQRVVYNQLLDKAGAAMLLLVESDEEVG
jgi:hypothetical protein